MDYRLLTDYTRITDYLLITDLSLQVLNNCEWLHETSISHQNDRHSKQQTSSNHKLHHIGLCANVCENSFESTRVRRTNKHDISSLFIAGFSPTTYESG